jgi:hypothetical protein
VAAISSLAHLLTLDPEPAALRHSLFLSRQFLNLG